MKKALDLQIYLIADFSYGLDRIEEALKAGVTILQLREKNISSREYLVRAKAMRQLTTHYHIPFIINDRIDIALLSAADGVHLGQSDLPINEARSLLGSEFIIGATAKTLATAQDAEHAGADYIGSGAWFTTSTKSDATPIDREEYKKIIATLGIPSVAIGGITPTNGHIPLEYGAHGLAMSQGILGATDITSTIKALKKL